MLSLDSMSPVVSIFKNKSIQLQSAQKLFRTYPFIPVEYDIVYDTFSVLKQCDEWSLVESTKPYSIRIGLAPYAFSCRSHRAPLSPLKEDRLSSTSLSRLHRVYQISREE